MAALTRRQGPKVTRRRRSRTRFLPFTTSLLGTPVAVTDVDFDGDQRRSLVATVERDGSSATISILDLDLTATDPAVIRLVAAYRRWLGSA